MMLRVKRNNLCYLRNLCKFFSLARMANGEFFKSVKNEGENLGMSEIMNIFAA